MKNQHKSLLRLDQAIIETVRKKKPQTVRELVKLIAQSHRIREEEIIEHIIALHNQGKLILKEQPHQTPLEFKGYLLSKDAYWYWIVLASAFAAVSLVFSVPGEAYPLVYARYLLGSLFVLWWPGYAFIKALFPTKELDSVERAALSIGMSLALVPITGLLLNYSPWGIRLIPITLSLLALTLIFATAAIIREHQVRMQESSRRKPKHI